MSTAPDWSHSALTRRQIVTIGRLAREAWEAELAAGRVVIPAGVSRSAALATWRHGQQQAAAGKASLRDCTQADFRPLRSHFAAIIGTPAHAATSFREQMRTGPVRDTAPTQDTHEARELWRHKIAEALRRWQLQPGYAEAICRRQYRCSVAAATAEQLRRLLFTVNNRGRAKARQRAGYATGDACPF